MPIALFKGNLMPWSCTKIIIVTKNSIFESCNAQNISYTVPAQAQRLLLTFTYDIEWISRYMLSLYVWCNVHVTYTNYVYKCIMVVVTLMHVDIDWMNIRTSIDRIMQFVIAAWFTILSIKIFCASKSSTNNIFPIYSREPISTIVN